MPEPVEKPKKEKKYKNQIHLRVGEDITKALEDRAAQEGVTVTALAIRYMKQGLGWEQESPPSIDIAEIEKRVSERVLNCISQVDEAALEEQLYNRVFERISQDLINYATNLEAEIHKNISECVSNLIHTQNEQSLVADSPSEIINNTRAEEQKASVSTTNTEIHTDYESTQDNIPIPEEHIIETTPTGVPLLFDSIDKGQIVKPSEIARYLREIEKNSTWELHKVRRLKNKQLTYLKKPADKRQSEPPLPMITSGYLIDWTPSEAFESLDNTTSTGKSWWIQRLPSDPAEAEKLISARRKEWNNPP